jgi:arginyl-tRNA synthetase
MKEKIDIAEIIAKEVKIKKEDILSSLEVPKESNLGDFAFPCFKLVSILKKNPVEIAKMMAGNTNLKGKFEKVEARGPYLNFFVKKSNLVEESLKRIFDEGDSFGKSKEGNGKTILIDFSSPNVGKPMHIGHIRTTIIGDSLMRIYNFLGWRTVGINYLGDIGLHIGKLIVAWELWLDKKALKQDPVKELLRIYIKFCKNEKSEIVEGQDEAEDYSNNEWTKKAKEKLKLIELGDKKAHKIWKEIREASGKGFDRVYKMLKVNFTETTGQSKFSEIGKEIILNAAKKSLVRTDETGAMYMEFDNLPKKFVLRSNGTASYITQDIGAAVSRYKTYKFDKMIYVVDVRQSLHFQQLFELLKRLSYNFSDNCLHLAFGTVSFGKEIIATREGNIILLEDVFKKTVERAEEEIKKRKTGGNAEAIGVASLKYAILKNEPIKDVEFSWDVALNFEGDTGPYLQYAYARASSIIKKAESNNVKLTNSVLLPDKIEPSEVCLVKKIIEFPEIIKHSSERFDPSLIAHYSFQLAQLFNEFYHSCPVLESKEESFRIKLVEAFRTTIKNALYLLGIEVMEEM